MIYPFEHIRIKHNQNILMTLDHFRKKRRGEVLHLALSYIDTIKDSEDIPLFVMKALSRFGEDPSRWDIENDLVKPLEGIFKLKGIEEIFPETSDKNIRILKERDFLSKTSTIRPDRVVIYEDHAVVIDFKTDAPGDKKTIKENRTQVRDYMKAVRTCIVSNVKGYLLYIEPPLIEEIKERD